MGLIQLARDLKQYRRSLGKGQITPQVRDPVKSKQKKLPKGVKKKRN